jgi:8-oxo-dGTP pyrophosphatase MutT (NUDIX family)
VASEPEARSGLRQPPTDSLRVLSTVSLDVFTDSLGACSLESFVSAPATGTPRAPVEPKPAASVLLVRDSPPGSAEPLEVYMIRRNRGMKFLGGYYAFPGGRVDPADGSPAALARCRGIAAAEAEAIYPGHAGVPALAFWITAVRELLEESGVLLACDERGHALDPATPRVRDAVERCRAALMAGDAPFEALMAREGWYCDLRPLRYLSHFTTPTSSPIRFAARFFLSPIPMGQEPRLFTEETSEGFWIFPGEGYRRFLAGEMKMAEPAEYGLAYLSQFASLDELWRAHDDGRLKFQGIADRIDVLWSSFDWKQNRFPGLTS